MTPSTPPSFPGDGRPGAPVPAGVRIRAWQRGDDHALAEVLPAPSSPAQLAARALLREPEGAPLVRTVVAEVGAKGSTSAGATTVVVGAAAIAESPAHPQRAWAHVEVAPAERGRGFGRALLEAAVAGVADTGLAGLGLRARTVAGDGAGEAFARSVGFTELFTTRIVRIDSGALGLAGADSVEDLQVIDTGSVALTKAFAEWYEKVNVLDPAASMTPGQVNTRFLSEAVGARGAALWRPAADDPAREQDINRRPVTAFAVSFAQEEREGSNASGHGTGGLGTAGVSSPDAPGAARAGAFADRGPEDWDSPALSATGGEDATELTAGSVNGEEHDLRALLARLSTETPLALEVTSQMRTETAVVDELLAAGSAKVLAEYTTLVRDR